MVPADIILLDELPYLDSGKLDRKALQKLYSRRKQRTVHVNGGESSRLRTIIETVSDVLGVPVDTETQLAAAGLDSLSSIRLSSKLRYAGLPQPDATVLLESRTAREIEVELDKLQCRQEGQSSDEVGAETSCDLRDAAARHVHASKRVNEIDDVFAPTPMQSAMLIETARDNQAYCNWVEFELTSDFSIENVCACIQELARQHVLLRSGFLTLNEAQMRHAVVVWKSLRPSQIRQVEHLDYDFKIADEADLLCPCYFQLLPSKRGIRVLLQIHHALYDQWSLDIFRSDLGTLLLGRGCASRPSFRSVSAFHAAHLGAPEAEESLEFWHEHLRQLNTTSLPPMNGERVPRKLQGTPWCDMTFDLTSLRDKARQLGCSVPTFFQAAMTYLLGCYTGSTDVTLGVVFSGRHIPVPGVEGVFGPCLTTLPLRIDYFTTRTNIDLLSLIHNQNRTLQRHLLTPLADIKNVVQDSHGARLFDTLFVWQGTSLSSQSEAEVVREVDSADHHEFDLVLEFEPSKDGFRARATYQQALISSQQVELFILQVQALAHHFVADSNSLIEDLTHSLPDSALSISNSSPSLGSLGRDLVTTIEQRGKNCPTSPALVFASSVRESEMETQVLTYKDLNTRSNRLANFIRSESSTSDDKMCICMEKSIDLYVAILATIKAGSGYLPLLPDTPANRMQSIFDQVGVKMCLCDTSSVQSLSRFKEVKAVNVTRLDLRDAPSDSSKTTFPGKNVAYTVFTSGSTGEPKGVAVTMGNLLGNLQVLAELYQVEPGDRLLQICSQAFDVSVFEIFFALYTGMCLCSASKDVLLQDLESSIRALSITHLSLTPTVAALIDPANVPSVRFLVTAGEAITDLVHKRWAGRGLHQGYGPSETTNICNVNMNMSANDALGNIGPPLRNTSAFVISPGIDFQLLPAGAVGEFVFGGEQVFQGYVGMDSLNAEKIIRHPQYGRLYRSGDVGRMLPDGSLLICGRLDDQVKLRGNRVELGEINAVLLRDPDVRDCTTLIIGKIASEQVLAALIVPKQSSADANNETERADISKDTITRLFERMEESLPSYMIPNVILPISNIPLTSQGKQDRRAIRDLIININAETISGLTRTIEEPNHDEHWSIEEQTIAAMLAETLQIDSSEIRRHRSFFSLGLNSLNAIAFARTLSNTLDADVSVSTVLRNPSSARLARKLVSQHESTLPNGHSYELSILPFEVVKEVQKLCSTLEDSIDGMLPCTPLQEAMLSASARKTQNAYCNSTILDVNGDLLRLKQSWSRMMSRHPILRTTFVTTDAPAYPYVQVVLKGMALPWHQHELDSSANPSSMENFLVDDRSNIVDRSNPFRIDTYTIGSSVKLVLHMHHAIYDGISMSRLLEEVELDYRGINLPPAISSDQFLLECQKYSGDDAMTFWSTQLHGFRPKPFPREVLKENSGELTVKRVLPASYAELESFCTRYAHSQLAIFQTALAKVLSRCQGVEDICFGNVVSGRTVLVESVERLVAPCFNTIPVRIDLAKTHNNVELVAKLNQSNIDALSYQLTPLRRIQTLSDSSSSHLFDSLLMLQPPQYPLDPSIWSVEQEVGDMDVPLVFEIIPTGGHFELILHYQQPDISNDLANGISEAFALALESCLKYPAGAVMDFNGRDEKEIAGTLASVRSSLEHVNGEVPLFQAKCTPEEDTICHVFAQMAGVARDVIQRGTSLYQIGLDSLNAAQIASRLRPSGIDVDAADVLESLTPYALASLAKTKVSTATSRGYDFDAFDRQYRGRVLKRLQCVDDVVEAVRPCTPVQCGMIAQSLQSSGKLYINHISYRVPDSVPVPNLQQAWAAVTERHRVMRMGFHSLEDSQYPFAMSILSAGSASVPIHEVKEVLSRTEAEDQAASAIMKSIGAQAWCIAIQPRDEHKIMLLSLHHALYDANSLHVILADFAKALTSYKLEAPMDIDPLLDATLSAATDNDGSTADFWSNALRDLR